MTYIKEATLSLFSNSTELKNFTSLHYNSAHRAKYAFLGRSMIEMLGVLAIIGVLSVGGIAGYSKAMNNFKINKTTDQVSNIIANINTMKFHAGVKDVDSNMFTKEVLQAMSIVPQEMWNGDNIINEFGGDVSIGTPKDITGGAARDGYIIVFDGISSDACLSLSSKDWGKNKYVISANDSGVDAVSGVTDGYPYFNLTCNVSPGLVFCENTVMSPAQAGQACSCNNDTCSFSIWSLK